MITDYQIFQIANVSGNHYYDQKHNGGRPVIELIKKGWQPFGSPFCRQDQAHFQAFIKCKEKK